jgi:hypothetical protein
MSYEINTFIFFSLFFLFSFQITILGPPAVVNKVKELEDGSKYKYINLFII